MNIGRLLFNSPNLLPAVLIIGAMVLVLVLWLYPSEVRLLPARFRWLLPALRVLGLIALASALLRPVMVRPRTTAEQGAVVVLVDSSKSMSVVDSGRTPAQLVALADAMGALPPDARAAMFTRLVHSWSALRPQVDDLALARTALDYAKLTGQGVESAQQRFRASSSAFAASLHRLHEQSDSLPSEAKLVETIKAIQDNLALEEASATAPLRAQVQRIGDVIRQQQLARDEQAYESNAAVRKACDELARLSRFDLVQRMLLRPNAGLLARLGTEAPIVAFSVDERLSPISVASKDGLVNALPMAPTGARSDLSGALRDLQDQLRGQTVQAILLFSDGRQVGGESHPAAAGSALGAPLFAISVGGQVKRDLAITRLSLPLSQFVGETIIVRADIRGIGFRGASFDAKLDCGDVHDTRRVTLDDRQQATVEFPLRLTTAGAQKVRVSIAPQSGEASIENNAAEQLTKVIADKVRVLALAGAPTWDFQYIRNAFTRANWMRCQAHILEGAATPALTREQILDQDVILLSAVHEAMLSPAQWQTIVEFINTRGGTVIVVGTDESVLAEYASTESLNDLIPYRPRQNPRWRTWPGEEAFFRLVPAPGTDSIDALKLADTPAESKRRWEQLPAMFHFMALPELKPNAQVLLLERDSNSAVLTDSRVGTGRVIFFGADETWRWRAKIGERDQDRFWLQLSRYAVEEPYALRHGDIAFDVDRLSSRPGETIRVRARSTTRPTIQITRNSNKDVGAVTMDRAGEGRYETTLSDLRAGEYTLKLQTGEEATKLSLPLTIAQDTSAEMRILSGDEVRLANLTAGTGGDVIRIEEAGELPQRLRNVREKNARPIEYSLWDSPYLFCFVLGCLGAEWALRKRFGLA
ncbi:MAG TPA: hypothetical protein VL282_08000 [Tepidisphaeraceae bacterium]|jgi:hypothetical protein|nr:hypothetical protein [Tepidisphaeraceae bacterium]